MTRRLFPFVLALSVLCGTLLTAGCHPKTESAPASDATSLSEIKWPAKDLRWNWLSYYTVKPGRSIPALPVPGKVTPVESESWTVQPPVPGRVETVAARVGQEVHRGDRLVQIRSSALAELQRDLTQAEQALTLKQKTARNAQTLNQAHAIAEKDLLAALQDARDAELNMKTASSKLHALNIELHDESSYWLKAPHDGVIVKADVTPGQEARPDSQPLLEMAALEKLVVWAQVLESDLDGIDKGDLAHILSPGRGDREVVAKVEAISRAVDPEMHTVGVRLLTSHPAPWLRPNGYVQVVFDRQSSTAITVPSEAVVTDDLDSVVFVKATGGRLLKRSVIVGHQGGGLTEVVRGLHAGETIVSKGAILLLNEVGQ